MGAQINLANLLGRWQRWVDPRVAVDERWHSSRSGLVRSPTLLGNHLVSQLRELAGTTDDDMALARTGQFLHKKLRRFEMENRLLLRLADSGRVILLLQRTIESVLGMSDLLESEIRDIWDRNLESERLEWIREIENVLKDEEKMKLEMGDCHQQLQILTLLKHQFAQYSEILTSRELDVVSEVFDWVTRRGNVVVGRLPHWFAASELEWFRAKRTAVEGGEETCERQATLWAKLHHPNVRKFFGACHVGNPFVIHEASSELPLQLQSVPNRRRQRKTRGERAAIKKLGRRGARSLGKATQTWRHLLGCALGLQYVHDRGLVHQRLTTGHLLYSQASQKGVLSGMGLMRRRGIDSNEFNEEPSVPSDILALGLAIFEITVKNRSPGMDITFERLPDVRPEFIRKTEWSLLLGMCTPDPAKRTCMADVVHQLSVLARCTPPPVPKRLANAPVTVEDVSGYNIQSLGMTLPETLEEIHQLCREVDNDNNRPVYDRLEDVYHQLVARSKPAPTALVESFSLVVLRFLDMLDQRALGGTSFVASMCASATISGKNYSFHHDIDTLLRTYDMETTASIHRWQTAWRKSRQQQVNTLKACLDKSETVLNEIPNVVDRSEALALMQFAAKNQFGDSLQDGIDDFNDLPLWFIPPYQVQIGKHIAGGSFGAVYEGEWLDTDVVVKQVLLDPSDKENWEQFRREADLWFSLNHPNLIKLYGACHQGRPFFVCEPASHGTLATYLKDKNRRTIWFAIGDAALGLQHLHDHGIIHGDLKGNNILVCDSTDGYPTAKLADFGLSIVTTRSTDPSSGESGDLGAFRWKAPECLLGARPTFESDIYSFGMCILEAISGQYPWGNTLPDAVVARNVVEMQQLPARPECVNDDEWQLITRMCRYQPHRRIPIGAVINCAFNLAG